MTPSKPGLGETERGVRPARLLLAILAVVALATPGPVARADEPGSRKSVLLVHAEDPYLPWVSGVTAGIYAALEKAPSGRPEVYVEHLDLARFPDPAHARARSAWLLEKYRGRQMDAIVAVTREALDFLGPLRAELWPGVPVVLVENERLVRETPLPPGVTAVLARFEIGETLDLAHALLPKTRRVAFVNGASDLEQTENDHFRRDLQVRGDGLELIDLSALPMAELKTRIASLPEDTIILYGAIRVDGAGRSFIPREALALLAPLSNRPIFGVSATMIGYGLTGGRVLDYTATGKEAGRTILRLIGGEPVALIPPSRKSFSRAVFDDRELRRFRIPVGRIPQGSEIRFGDETLWSRHPHLVAGAVAAFVVQAALIATLLLERRRRGLAQSLTGATLASLPGQVAVLDSEGRVVQVNQNWEAFTVAGASSPAGGVAVGESYLAAWRRAESSAWPFAETGIRVVQEVLQGITKHDTLEYSLHEAGRDRWFEMHVEEMLPPGRGAVVVQVDVTRRHDTATEVRMREREIAHLNRVGAVGELASSLAHELGQPLGAILANAQAARRLLARPSPDLEEVRASVSDIIEDDQRAGHVIQRIRALLRGEETPKDTVDLNEIVRSVLHIMGGEASLRSAAILTVLASAPVTVHGDRVQLEQVVLNLVLNGLDAVAERTVGQREVRVSTSAANGSVEVSVSDSGPGIRSPNLERVFEPFYTTKSHGLGMGLSICRSIVEAHGGEIRVENVEDGGAAFRCAFPAAGSLPA